MGHWWHGGERRRGNTAGVLRSMLIVALAALSPRAFGADVVHGLPIARAYSFDEIGDVSQGVHLAFDDFGRVVAVQDGALMALNDNEWIDLARKDRRTATIQAMSRDADGTLYYGAQGSCGVLRRDREGELVPEPLTPLHPPDWVSKGTFDTILCRREGVYFASFNGIAFCPHGARTLNLLAIPSVAGLFTLDNRVFVSSHDQGTRPLDPATMSLGPRDVARFGGAIISNAADFRDGTALVATTGRRLFLYRHGQLVTLPAPLDPFLDGQPEALASLSTGEIAVAIAGSGVYFVDAHGDIQMALTTPGYSRVNALATDEPGVLWLSGESSVRKVLYGIPLEWFGESLGIQVSWPQVVSWRGSVVIASHGRAYEPNPTVPGEPTHFRLVPDQPMNGTWAIASFQDWLLLANGDGVFARKGDQPFARISTAPAARLIMLDSGVCLVVASNSIAALRYSDGRWSECAPRVNGIGYPSIVHAARNSAWIEIGGNRAARIALRDGRIDVRFFSLSSAHDTPWVCVSVIGDTVVLSGPDSGRLFFDERAEEPRTHAAIGDLLDAAPYWIARVAQDDKGTYWLSHGHGIITATKRDGLYSFDTATYRSVTDHMPLVQTLPQAQVWLSRGDSLYHVTQTEPSNMGRAMKPLVVSVRDVRTRDERLDQIGALELRAPLAFDQNSVALRLFTGSYALRRCPSYEFRVNDEPWSDISGHSVLRLPDLHEGSYNVSVRLVDEAGVLPAATEFHFTVLPPWYRTWWAYVGYVIGGAAIVLLGTRVALLRVQRRNAELAKLVSERTAELERTMQKLERETHTAATLAERNRLAGEIHDSLEQGFSALWLQLETIAGMAKLPAAVDSALATARNMIAFSRNEVRHAVADLHSPMLDRGGLEAALTEIVTNLAIEPTRATLSAQGTARPLGSTVEHHLLRIAQEAIANAIKHAHASRLEIELVFRATEVELRISDNGCGFDPQTVLAGRAKQDHFGLRSLRGRARKIEGSLEIKSKPGEGTRIIVRVPHPNTA